MAQAAHAHGSSDHHSHGHGGGHGHGPAHGASYYVKIWGILLILLIISILGPMLGHRGLTIATAFGIAVVKALIVAAYFMHLNIEKRYIWYLLFSMMLMVALFFWGISADIRATYGSNWINRSADQHIENHPMFAPHEEHPSGEQGAAPAASGHKEP